MCLPPVGRSKSHVQAECAIGSLVPCVQILRVAVRIEGFIRAVLRANDTPLSTSHSSPPPPSPFPCPAVRGMKCGEAVLSDLRQCSTRLRVALVRDLHTMVEGWCNVCLKRREVTACSTLFAHLAFVYKYVEEEELNYHVVSTVLCAQARVTHASPSPSLLPSSLASFFCFSSSLLPLLSSLSPFASRSSLPYLTA